MFRPAAPSSRTRVLSRISSTRPVPSRGSALLYVIASIVLLGAIGGGVAYFSSSSSTSQLTQTRAEQAYSAALAGLNFANSISEAECLSAISAGKTYFTIDDGQGFYLTVLAKSGANYPAMILGVSGGNGGETTNFRISQNIPCLASTSEGNALSEKMMVANNISVGGDFFGDIVGNTISMNDGSNVTGSIISTSATSLLTVTKNTVGTASSPVLVCSNANISIPSSGMVMYANIYSQGFVEVERPVSGNIYAGGSVTLSRNATITGEIRSQSTVDLRNGNLIGNVYVNSPSLVQGTNKIQSGGVHTPAGEPPSLCPSSVFSFPDHEKPATSLIFNASSSSNCANSKCIFLGSDLSDHSYSYKSFTADWGTKLCFDVSSGYVNIFVSDDVLINAEIHIKTSSSQTCFVNDYVVSGINLPYSDYASKIYIDTSGKATFGGAIKLFGTVYAKKDILFGSGNHITGSLYSSEGSITGIYSPQPNLNMQYVQSDYFKSLSVD